MPLTTAIIREKALPKAIPHRLDDEDGLYLLVRPDGGCAWHFAYELDGAHKDLQLGSYPELSLSDARKRRSGLLRLLAQGIDPDLPPPAPKAKPTAPDDAAPTLLEPIQSGKLAKKPKKTPAEGLPELPLIAYKLNKLGMTIVPGFTDREWMDQTAERFAYRCMPMLIANQQGWLVLSSHTFSAIWDGRRTNEGLKITSIEGEGNCPALSMFGSGIITLTMPYLFRTPPGYNLLAMGPPNWPKDGVCALSGVIETDWAESTFTMNWKITRPHHTVTFEKGEPICMIVPQRRYEVESFRPVIRDINSNMELKEDYMKWAQSRQKFNSDLKIQGSEAQKVGWQKHYAQGKTVSEKRSTVHQSKLVLREFVDEIPPESDKN